MYRSRLQYLLLEVPNGVLVSVSKEIQDVVFDVILLQVVHQVGTVALTLKKDQIKENTIKKKKGYDGMTSRLRGEKKALSSCFSLAKTNQHFMKLIEVKVLFMSKAI